MQLRSACSPTVHKARGLTHFKCRHTTQAPAHYLCETWRGPNFSGSESCGCAGQRESACLGHRVRPVSAVNVEVTRGGSGSGPSRMSRSRRATGRRHCQGSAAQLQPAGNSIARRDFTGSVEILCVAGRPTSSRMRHDFILFDSPPLLVSPDAQMLLNLVDKSILVIRLANHSAEMARALAISREISSAPCSTAA
jgi:hypothetical protein